jgi:hypothetical protein
MFVVVIFSQPIKVKHNVVGNKRKVLCIWTACSPNIKIRTGNRVIIATG